MADLQRKSENFWTLYPNQTYRGVTFEFTNNTIKMNNTCTQEGNIQATIDLKAGTYTIAANANINIPQNTHILQIYKENVVQETIPLSDMISGKATFTIAEDTTDILIRIHIMNGVDYSGLEIQPMLNEGSTAKPYEPNGWVHSLRKLTTASEIITPPTTIYADGTAITAYTLKGNTVQNGTPSPSNPVDVNGVGELTDNLFNLTAWANSITSVRGNGTMSVSGTTVTLKSVDEQDAYTLPYSSNAQGVYKIPVKPNTVYRTRSNPSTYARFIVFENGLTQSGYMHTTNGPFTTQADTTYLSIRMGVASTQPLGTSVTISDFMISEGATEKDYEPYGYKIPISSGGVTTNIYLGSTQTVRQIKKIVFDGTEDWQGPDNAASKYLADIGDYKVGSEVTCMSTHYSGANNIVSGDIIPNNSTCFYNATYPRYLYLKGSESITLADFKAYLAAQYAAGTPVTVWYVLATPQTAAVNEPLMKIGDYSDSIANATAIPTTDGANSITVDTTVQPSEFTATWTGWHNSSVKEKSENLLSFDELNSTPSGEMVSLTSGTTYTMSHVLELTLEPNTTYKLSSNYDRTSSNQNIVYLQYADAIQSPNVSTSPTGITDGEGKIKIGFYDDRIGSDEFLNGSAWLMLNEGQTALPYEPYWK